MCVGEWTEGGDNAVTGLLPPLFSLLTLCKKKNSGAREAGIGLILLDRGRYSFRQAGIEARRRGTWEMHVTDLCDIVWV